MPRNVRNFWVEVDAGHTRTATGPRSSAGGFETLIYLRERGQIIGPIRISGRVTGDDRLIVEAWPHGGLSPVILAECAR